MGPVRIFDDRSTGKDRSTGRPAGLKSRPAPDRFHLCFLFINIYLFFRVARNDRDSRAYESRFKQYENEISELKARYDSITFDASRRIEENEVFLFLNF